MPCGQAPTFTEHTSVCVLTLISSVGAALLVREDTHEADTPRDGYERIVCYRSDGMLSIDR